MLILYTLKYFLEIFISTILNVHKDPVLKTRRRLILDDKISTGTLFRIMLYALQEGHRVLSRLQPVPAEGCIQHFRRKWESGAMPRLQAAGQ